MPPGVAVGRFERCISPGALYMRRYLVKQRIRLRLMWTRHQVSSVLAAETASLVCDPVNFRLLLAMWIIYPHHELGYAYMCLFYERGAE